MWQGTNDEEEMNSNVSHPHSRSPQDDMNKALLGKLHISNHSGIRLWASLWKVFLYSGWEFL
jgi:hypothetical protein